VTEPAGGELSVSLNGVDNVGKTTQLAWLSRGMPGATLVGTVDAWDVRWRQLAAGDFAHWWFVASSTAEHVEFLLGSHVARRAASGPLALEDRGLPMLRAACAATAAIKEGLSVAQAVNRVDRIAAGLPAADSRPEVHLLLRRSGDPVREAAEALRRELGTVDARYTDYQHTLADVLALQAARGEYDAVLDIGTSPILDVQRQIRTRLAERGVSVQPLPEDRLNRIWVLGGLSESGKSTVGELLRDEHGATRLKIGYLLEVAAARAGVADPYESWSEREQAERLSEEILRFAEATKSRTVSIESAHRFEATAHLKRVWGNRAQVVYVDADPAVRAARATEPAAELSRRDDLKRERGAHRVIGIADHVIDNSGPLSSLKLLVGRLVTTVDLRAAPAAARTAVTHSRWLANAVTHLRDAQVAAVLATGSTGTSSWREKWSDLDLLVVRDAAPAAWLRDVAGTLAGIDGVKVGVSVFTTGDIEALRVPPRVVQSLRRAAQGEGLLYRREDYLLPVPAHADADRTSRGELGLVLMTTRRLLAAGHPDVRALHKHLVLLAKILLRADGRDVHDAEEVVATFQELHPAAGCDPPGIDDLITSPSGTVEQRLVQATDQLLTYFDGLGRGVRTAL